ncbi:BTAD domain-containing putative transcriptional regulator [Paractinoplanes globisporus]|uniref:BTAD domain-containing putative transcriptional regulator n=1 Tax=Paractinoplanes globisporus TaxID=113565 RepID=A0ABW6WKR4_9ACTN|nr:BTAD domain-containing putative transcriptional regulator [Actinoplanes globisporus]
MGGDVTLAVLGPLRATVGGSEADLGGPRQRAVLARLAVAGGEVVSADRIIEDLWGGGADVPARQLATLQVYVSHLRRALEPDRLRRTPAAVLVSAAPGYALRLPAEAVDAWRFDDLVRQAAEEGPAARHRLLTEALDGWRGGAYAEVADEAWARPEAARLDELRLAAVESLAEAELALGRAAIVVATMERHLHDHPGREEAVRLLALALYRSGRQGDALEALRRTRRHLADELGVDPGPALRALEADILAQAPALDAPVPLPPAASVTRAPVDSFPRTGKGTWGRQAELAAIAAAADEAARHGARVVLIGGEAGAGKTTLAEAAVAALATGGWKVHRGRCPEVEGAPPGWAWSEALGSEPVDGPANPFRLGRAIAAGLDGGKAVVLLDDVHRADDLTLQLLRQVVAQRAPSPLLVIVTYRTTDRGDELEATIGALLTSTAAHLLLGGLDAEAIAALARREGLVAAGPDVLALVAERTGGNPLFVRELARLLAAEGTDAAGTAVPAGVREVLRRRVARLPDPVTAALRQAAVLGREADVDVLAEVAGRDPDEVLDALEAAVLAGLLDEPVPGVVRFTHALVRDTLYEDTPLLRRARLHSRALSVLGAHRADAATLARHAAAAAGPATAHEAIPYATNAARAAEEAGSWREAAAQWRSALRLRSLAGTRATGAPTDLLAPAVNAHARAGDIVRARSLYLSVPPDPALLTAWDAPLVWTTRQSRSPDFSIVDGIYHFLDGISDPVARVRLLLALFRELEGHDDAAAAEVSAEALDLARTVGDLRLLCGALNARAYSALGPDLRAIRRSTAEEYLAASVAAGEIDHEAVAHWLLFLDSAAHTDLDGARTEMARAVARSTTGQLSSLLAVVAIFDGLLSLLAGRTDEALARYEDVGRRLTDHGAMNGALMVTVGRVSVAVFRGDLSPLVDELLATDEAFAGRISDPLVLALLDAGRRAEAEEVWARRLPIDRNYYWLGLTAMRGHAAARLGDAATGREIFEELLPFAGRVAGLDSGSLYGGPVDAALFALSGDIAYRDSAGALLERLRR